MKSLGGLIFQLQNLGKIKQTEKRIQGKLARKVFKERLLETLKRSQNENKPNKETVQAMTKIQNHKKLTSKEFQNAYDLIWKEGPKTAYQNPDSWRKSKDPI